MKFEFIRGLTHRNGMASSKKTWFNGACLTATAIMAWLAYKLPTVDGMDDWAFIWLFAIYLVTVGGFDVLLEMMKLALQWKTVKEINTLENKGVPP